jgi:hypothetical protein
VGGFAGIYESLSIAILYYGAVPPGCWCRDGWAVSLTNLLDAGVEWRRYKIKPIRATQTEARAGARLDDRR